MFHIHYGQRGLRIYRESSWYEIDRGLAQVVQVKPRILAVRLLTLATPSRYCETSPRWKLLLFFNASYLPQYLHIREIWLRDLMNINSYSFIL